MKRVHLCRCRLAVVRAFVVVLLVAALPLSAVRAATEEARVVKYSKEDIVPVRAKLRFSTLIVLPEDERSSTSPPETRNSGSSTGRTICATCIPRRPAFAAT